MGKIDLTVVADHVFEYCKHIGHNMGCIHIQPQADGSFFLRVTVLDRHDRPYSRDHLTKGIVADTQKLIECGILLSEMLLGDLSTKH